MKSDISVFTPYIMFFFGIVITYIGWSTKKILENIEGTIKKTAEKVEDHSEHITILQGDIRLHGLRLDTVEREVVEFKKTGRI